MKRLFLGFIIGACLLSSVVMAVSISGGYFDVDEKDWFSDAVNSVAEKGIMSGYGDGSFRPGENVNRAELAESLDNLIDYIEEREEVPDSFYLDVPFTAQAPHSNWDMPYQEACEEASLIMVHAYLRGEELNAEKADQQILELVKWESENGMKADVNAAETVQIAEEFYGLEAKAYYEDEVTIAKIKELISQGHPVILPVAGQLLGNPNFSGAGPPYHMIVLVGYDEENFISHDPGTRLGADYKYSIETIDNAIHDWTGSKNTIEEGRRAMIVVQ